MFPLENKKYKVKHDPENKDLNLNQISADCKLFMNQP